MREEIRGAHRTYSWYPLTAKTRVRTPLGPPRMPKPPKGGFFILGGYIIAGRGSKRAGRRVINEDEPPWTAAEARRAGPERNPAPLPNGMRSLGVPPSGALGPPPSIINDLQQTT